MVQNREVNHGIAVNMADWGLERSNRAAVPKQIKVGIKPGDKVL